MVGELLLLVVVVAAVVVVVVVKASFLLRGAKAARWSVMTIIGVDKRRVGRCCGATRPVNDDRSKEQADFTVNTINACSTERLCQLFVCALSLVPLSHTEAPPSQSE